MYVIKINDHPLAVTENLKKAMDSVKKLVADYLGICNENFINLGNGIRYCPWSNFAHCKIKTEESDTNDESFDVVIDEIKVL